MSKENKPQQPSELDKAFAEYQIGFVVGDKDIENHFKEFKQQLSKLVSEIIGLDGDRYESKIAHEIKEQQRQRAVEKGFLL